MALSIFVDPDAQNDQIRYYRAVPENQRRSKKQSRIDAALAGLGPRIEKLLQALTQIV